MLRGEVYWADLPSPLGRRPALVVTRDAALPVRRRVTIAPITTNVRGIDSEVALGASEGLPRRSIASCDNLQTVPMDALGAEPVGRLDVARIPELDQALRYALEFVLAIPSRRRLPC